MNFMWIKKNPKKKTSPKLFF